MGIPTVADRIAQTVVKQAFELTFRTHFLRRSVFFHDRLMQISARNVDEARYAGYLAGLRRQVGLAGRAELTG